MHDLLALFLAFSCGCFVGFIVAAFFAVGKRASDAHDFDGGFRASNLPPAHTRIWSDAIRSEGRE